ncbi:MAG: hypothetical protein DRN08_06045, partial [Thermoplasmata archaeon]
MFDKYTRMRKNNHHNNVNVIDTDDEYNTFLNSRKPVFITNKRGEFIDVNEAFCKQIGYAKDELLGLPLEETFFLTEDARKTVMYRNVSRLIGKNTPVYTLDVQTKKGDVLSLEIGTKPFFKNGKIAGEIGVVRKTIKRTGVKERKKKES